MVCFDRNCPVTQRPPWKDYHLEPWTYGIFVFLGLIALGVVVFLYIYFCYDHNKKEVAKKLLSHLGLSRCMKKKMSETNNADDTDPEAGQIVHENNDSVPEESEVNGSNQCNGSCGPTECVERTSLSRSPRMEFCTEILVPDSEINDDIIDFNDDVDESRPVLFSFSSTEEEENVVSVVQEGNNYNAVEVFGGANSNNDLAINVDQENLTSSSISPSDQPPDYFDVVLHKDTFRVNI